MVCIYPEVGVWEGAALPQLMTIDDANLHAFFH
jgi:hypothetical protein